MIEAHPLQWPAGRKRTSGWSRAAARFEVTFARARDNLVHEVHLLTGTSTRCPGNATIVISTNIALRRDGLPLANQRQPDDVGVAVYFTYQQQQRCFACDRWRKIEHNMQAIAKAIEALRGIARWGTGDMLEAVFTGFAALPMPGAEKPWRDVLGDVSTLQEAQTAYRRAASLAHPDRGGTNSQMVDLNKAWEQAQGELG
jgi:hypothetical protein